MAQRGRLIPEVPDPERGVLSDATLLVLRGIMEDTKERTCRQRPRPLRPARPHYPPDVLRISGRDRQRQLLRGLRSCIALSEAVGPCPRQLLYRERAGKSPAQGNCYHPQLLLALRQTLRAVLKRGRRDGYPAMASVHTGRGTRPLHLHIVCGPDAPMPGLLSLGEWGEFEFVPHDDEEQRTASDLMEYLYKTGHTGSWSFDPALPADDPGQPEPFRRALSDYRTARDLALSLGRKRLPARVFAVYLPRLTPAQTARARAEIELDRQQFQSAQRLERLTATEWKMVAPLFGHGAGTEAALTKLRMGLNLLLTAQISPLSLHQVWQRARRRRGHGGRARLPAYSTVCAYQQRYAPALAEAAALVLRQRAPASSPHDRLLAALAPRKISGILR